MSRPVLPVLCVAAFLSVATGVRGDEFRGMWVDALHSGFKSTSQINTLVSRAVTGRYNAIMAEVLAYQDDASSGHGAYWQSSIVPWAPEVSAGFDPLEYLCQQAHLQGIEVHVWMVPFRACNSWPPSGNSTLASNAQWVMVPRSSTGGGIATIDGHYMLDPGSPDVQEYLISIVREVVTGYEIDGVHWDYIRFTDTDAGYPSYNWYTKSGLARFRAIEGYAGTPAEDYGPWEDFRRREINELIRRGYVEIHTDTSNPRQPLRMTAALFSTGDAPANFEDTSAYELFQNWEYWMDKGWLDAACPMNYKREHCTDQAIWYRNWVDAAISWSHDRHVFCGQANYLNSFANSIDQLDYVYGAGADGSVNYSYYVTRVSETVCDDNDPLVADTSWYSYVAANIFTSTAALPAMPWHDPALATKGVIYGRVTDGATGEPIDNAEILVNGFPFGIFTDGNGFYVVSDLTAGPNGSGGLMIATAPGYPDAERPAVLFMRAGFTEANFGMGVWLAGDYDVDGDVDLADYERFADCITGPDAGPISPSCDLFDFDLDGDIDLPDFSVFQGAFSG